MACCKYLTFPFFLKYKKMSGWGSLERWLSGQNCLTRSLNPGSRYIGQTLIARSHFLLRYLLCFLLCQSASVMYDVMHGVAFLNVGNRKTEPSNGQDEMNISVCHSPAMTNDTITLFTLLKNKKYIHIMSDTSFPLFSWTGQCL